MDLNERIHKLKGGCKYTETTVTTHLKLVSISGKTFLQCPCCKKTFSSSATDAHIIPDYLNDDTETLKALIKARFHVLPHKFRDMGTDEWYESWGIGHTDKSKGETIFNDLARQKDLPTAIWLAWCEWMESKGE